TDRGAGGCAPEPKRATAGCRNKPVSALQLGAFVDQGSARKNPRRTLVMKRGRQLCEGSIREMVADVEWTVRVPLVGGTPQTSAKARRLVFALVWRVRPTSGTQRWTMRTL